MKLTNTVPYCSVYKMGERGEKRLLEMALTYDISKESDYDSSSTSKSVEGNNQSFYKTRQT